MTTSSHDKTLTVLEVSYEGDKMLVDHPSGHRDIYDVAQVMAWHANQEAELALGSSYLATLKERLKQMGSPIETPSMKATYLARHETWLLGGSPAEWLKEKGVLTKVIGVVEPK